MTDDACIHALRRIRDECSDIADESARGFTELRLRRLATDIDRLAVGMDEDVEGAGDHHLSIADVAERPTDELPMDERGVRMGKPRPLSRALCWLREHF